MRVKASNRPYWVDLWSGHIPNEAMPAILKHLKAPGDRVWVGFVVYERIA